MPFDNINKQIGWLVEDTNKALKEAAEKDGKDAEKRASERAKVLPRRFSGTCAKHQRKLRVAIMRARVLALIPYLAD